MKTDVLNLIATWTTLAEIVTWLWIAAPLLGCGAAAWAVIQIARRVVGSFARANQVIRHEVGPDTLRLLQDLDTHLDQTVASDPELAAAYTRLDTAARKETP